MIDIKIIRENKDIVKENIKRKFQDHKLPLVDEIYDLDLEFREVKQKGDNLRAMKNEKSSHIGLLMREGKKDEAEVIKKEIAEANDEINELSLKEEQLESTIKEKMMMIPNIIDPSVPIGEDDTKNVENEKFGEPVVPNFEVPHHADICARLNGLDKESAGRTSGNGFYYLMGDVARLHSAMLSYARDFMIDKGFTYSSNVAAAELGLELGKDKLIEYYKRFGFGSKTGIEMADEYSGIINPKYELEIANAAFGQGITTTPIQNIQALTTLANNGMLIKPYIVDKVIDPDTGETIYEGKRTEIEQVVNPETVDKMLELMNETVNGEDAAATGYVYRTASTALIGKTGTAQIVSSSGGYQTGNYNNIRSFAGLFPYKDPEYIVYISVKKLQASSRALAKPVKSIVESIAKYKNLDQLIVEQDESKIIKIENYINSYTDQTLSKLENSGLEVVKIGVGSRIIDQFPQKGSTMIKGNKLFLLTNSTEIFMPSMENWTTSEVGNYCNLAGINYNISGYGRVRTQSIPAGTELDLTSILDVTLTRKEEEVTTDEETEQTE